MPTVAAHGGRRPALVGIYLPDWHLIQKMIAHSQVVAHTLFQPHLRGRNLQCHETRMTPHSPVSRRRTARPRSSPPRRGSRHCRAPPRPVVIPGGSGDTRNSAHHDLSLHPARVGVTGSANLSRIFRSPNESTPIRRGGLRRGVENQGSNRLPLRRTITSCTDPQSAFVHPVVAEATYSCPGRRLCLHGSRVDHRQGLLIAAACAAIAKCAISR